MINRVVLGGRLVQDPELGQTSGGTAVVRVFLETEHLSSEQRPVESCRIEAKAFGPAADVLHRYLERGRVVIVEGYLREDQGRLVVIVESFNFMPDEIGSLPLWAAPEQLPARTSAEATPAPKDTPAPRPAARRRASRKGSARASKAAS